MVSTLAEGFATADALADEIFDGIEIKLKREKLMRTRAKNIFCLIFFNQNWKNARALFICENIFKRNIRLVCLNQ